MHAEGYISHSLKSINSSLFIIVLLNGECSLARGISVTPVPLMLGWKMLHSSRLTNGGVEKNARPQQALWVIINFAFTLKQGIQVSDVSEFLAAPTVQFNEGINEE